MNSLLIKNASAVITCDSKDTVMEHANILINNGVISYIGPEAQTADKTLDASGYLVYPGLINTHHHLYQTFSRNLPQVQNMELFDWLTTLYEIWKNLDQDVIYHSSITGMGELLKTGCTTCFDLLDVGVDYFAGGSGGQGLWFHSKPQRCILCSADRCTASALRKRIIKMETIGNTSGAILADALGSTTAAVFNALPNTAFGQNARNCRHDKSSKQMVYCYRSIYFNDLRIFSKAWRYFFSNSKCSPRRCNHYRVWYDFDQWYQDDRQGRIQ